MCLFEALAFTAKDAKEKQRAAKENDCVVFFAALLSFFAPLDKLGTGFAVKNLPL
jgi:hypothetical protein